MPGTKKQNKTNHTNKQTKQNKNNVRCIVITIRKAD